MGDLQHAESLGEQLHPHTVFIHTGYLHPLAAKKRNSVRREERAQNVTKGEVRSQERVRRREICKGGTQLMLEEITVEEEKSAEVRKNE